ncbi:uncharacterized protein LOC114650275 isoform X1 [Erpetoichthys calabaricus]|uniref:Interleukin-1 n=1 Tax=Erpetoichthys calabaricus TaxID=27687 RepID=A0A8C4X3I9_ERPCA|nr:uncharacterized protein LOC114650275 isoform X1 [Erpetoichthys calabaricus]
MAQPYPLKGDIAVIHTTEDGKNEYVIENAVLYNGTNKKKRFFRGGDKLLEVDNTDLASVPPLKLTELLSTGSAMLTVHRMNRKDPKPPHSESVFYKSKYEEDIILNLSLNMVNGNDIETETNNDMLKDSKNKSFEENLECPTQNKPGNFEKTIVVTLSESGIFIVRDRGLQEGCRCKNCNGCKIHDIIIQSGATEISFVSQNIAYAKEENIFLKSRKNDHYLHKFSSNVVACPMRISNSDEAKLTIYYYKSSLDGREYSGMPIILKFSCTNEYLYCDKVNDKVTLKLEKCCEKELEYIANDKPTWSFVFYMTDKGDTTRQFESAKYRNWFISCQEKLINLKKEAGDFLVITIQTT